jgi:DAACS family dicarboxylate/amino acid:cation (Na+ or H+) symporter
MNAPPPQKRSLPFYIRVLVGVAAGVALGVAFGTRPVVLGMGTQSLGDLGMLVIRVLKTLATPLILFAVLDALLRTQIPRKKGVALVALGLLNAAVAVGIGLGIANLLHSGDGRFVAVLAEPAKEGAPTTPAPPPGATLDPLKNLTGYIPENLVEPFRTNSVITIVLLAILVGLALRATKERGSDEARAGVLVIESAMHGALHACTRMLEWIVQVVPFAVAGVVASVVGKSGLEVAGSLGAFLGTVLLGLVAHAVIYYGVLLFVVGRTSPLAFWKKAVDPVTTALSCGSSLATLPVTLRTLEKMGVSTSSARLAAVVGTNLNHDGIILYEASATIFIAQAIGMHLSLGDQIGVALAAVMAGIGIAGVPEAGLITLPLVLGAGGIPAATASLVVPLILPVDWIIGRFRAATNVTSDMTVATLLDRFFPKDESGT